MPNPVPPVQGFGVVMDDKLLLSTVANTMRVAKINGLAVIAHMDVLQNATDEFVNAQWDHVKRQYPGLYVAKVNCEVVPDPKVIN